MYAIIVAEMIINGNIAHSVHSMKAKEIFYRRFYDY